MTHKRSSYLNFKDVLAIKIKKGRTVLIDM